MKNPKQGVREGLGGPISSGTARAVALMSVLASPCTGPPDRGRPGLPADARHPILADEWPPTAMAVRLSDATVERAVCGRHYRHVEH